ncbi:unnamed protein product [Euphydryas editha]|uniref:Zinc finger PHD-type domain-containing protein n=1 Tax=Euphydryas editha TaxID=104508 RepID=A0AAU9UHD7_EUPED|nr:unnamed protein product [Euphydryas editha]
MAGINSNTKRKDWNTEDMAQAIKLKNELPPEEAAPTTLGRKNVLGTALENILVDYILTMESKFYGLTRSDVLRMAYMLARRNQLRNPFGNTGLAGKKWLMVCCSNDIHGETWVKCLMCGLWAHNDCAGPESDVWICDFCK